MRERESGESSRIKQPPPLPYTPLPSQIPTLPSPSEDCLDASCGGVAVVADGVADGGRAALIGRLGEAERLGDGDRDRSVGAVVAEA